MWTMLLECSFEIHEALAEAISGLGDCARGHAGGWRGPGFFTFLPYLLSSGSPLLCFCSVPPSYGHLTGLVEDDLPGQRASSAAQQMYAPRLPVSDPTHSLSAAVTAATCCAEPSV